MKLRQLSVLSLALVTASAATAQTTLEWITLGATGRQDIASRAPIAVETSRGLLAGVSQEAVTFTYALPADQKLEASVPHQAESREYWVEVGGAQLRRGVDVHTTAAGALIRVNPAGAAQIAGKAASQAIDPAAFELRAAGRTYAAGQGMELLVSAEQLAASGAPFLEGTSAFRVAKALGAGTLQLALPTQADDSARYVIHVFEPASDVVLKLQATAGELIDGDTLVVDARLEQAGRGLAIDRIEAMVTAPSGRAWPIVFNAGKPGEYRGALRLDARAGVGNGLWEVQMVGSGKASGLTAVRGARTAFTCALPTAAFTGQVGVQRLRGEIGLTLPVTIGTEGRYEARGVLYGTDGRGQLRPLAIAHSAAWMGAGEATLTLGFDAATLAASGLAAPYELRDLRLYDQGRMGLLHRQERAAVIP
jgi:hypothetical protein